MTCSDPMQNERPAQAETSATTHVAAIGPLSAVGTGDSFIAKEFCIFPVFYIGQVILL